MKKKIYCVLLAAILIFAVGCSPTAPAPAPAPTPTPPAAQPAGQDAPDAPEAPDINFPTGPIRIIVPFSAGGSTDLMARVMQPHLSEVLGADVVIENRGGGGGAPGMIEMIGSAPDGHTVIFLSISAATLTPNISDVGYGIAEVAPIAQITTAPSILWARAGEGITTLQEFIDYASARPGELTYSSGGAGGAHHVAAETFFNAIGMPGLMAQVPFDSGIEGFTAFIGGHVDFAFQSVDDGRPFLDEGLIYALGVMDNDGDPLLPDIPTFQSQGVEVEAGSWWGFAAPAGTPDEILDLWDNAILTVLERPEVAELFLNLGQTVQHMPRGPFTEFWVEQFYFNRELIAELGLAS